MEQQDPPRRTRMPAAQRRESILAAAAEVFARAGYHSARVADIAALVGVSEPVVFQNFGSKPALFAAVLEHAAGQARASLDDATAGSGSAGSGSAAGLLLAHVIAPADGAHEPPGQPEPTPGHHGHGHGAAPGALFATALALAAGPEAPEIRGPVLRALAGHLADIVSQGQRDGSVRADVDPEQAAWLLISVLASRPLRNGAMPAGLEPAISDLVARLLTQGRPRDLS